MAAVIEAKVIEAKDLAKRYGEVEAVRGVSFAIPRGACIGLLGPNGAGKTTTMRMLMGLTRPTGGSLSVFGTRPESLGRAYRARIGLVHLEDKASAYARTLSGGMKRRLVIARALIADPELVVLDEPTTGLDPQARVLIWRRLLDLKKQGKTLLLTTHYMDEAQRLCDRIVIIDAGRVLDEDTPAGLIGRHVRGHVFELPKPLSDGFPPEGVEHEDIGDAVLFYVADPDEMIHRLPSTATYLRREANLEDVFLRLTGRRLREG